MLVEFGSNYNKGELEIKMEFSNTLLNKYNMISLNEYKQEKGDSLDTEIIFY